LQSGLKEKCKKKSLILEAGAVTEKIMILRFIMRQKICSTKNWSVSPQPKPIYKLIEFSYLLKTIITTALKLVMLIEIYKPPFDTHFVLNQYNKKSYKNVYRQH